MKCSLSMSIALSLSVESPCLPMTFLFLFAFWFPNSPALDLVISFSSLMVSLYTAGPAIHHHFFVFDLYFPFNHNLESF
jgi:hypothetical protein